MKYLSERFKAMKLIKKSKQNIELDWLQSSVNCNFSIHELTRFSFHFRSNWADQNWAYVGRKYENPKVGSKETSKKPTGSTAWSDHKLYNELQRIGSTLRKWLSVHETQDPWFEGLLEMRAIQISWVKKLEIFLNLWWNKNSISLHRCRARLRTVLNKNEQYTTHNFDDADQKVEMVCSLHNHEIITERRKKGSLKGLKEGWKAGRQEAFEEETEALDAVSDFSEWFET